MCWHNKEIGWKCLLAFNAASSNPRAQKFIFQPILQPYYYYAVGNFVIKWKKSADENPSFCIVCCIFSLYACSTIRRQQNTTFRVSSEKRNVTLPIQVCLFILILVPHSSFACFTIQSFCSLEKMSVLVFLCNMTTKGKTRN